MATRCIESIEVENFKSYRGRQVIGPFIRPFTAVIGPNGAGKSNLLDAISFVLGVGSADLRGKQLTDLIFRFEKGTTPQKVKCYVKLVYKEDDQRTSFKRTISAAGASSYHIDDKKVSAEEYNAALNEINIFPKLKNFLIFQGHVTSVASKSPKEITEIIEKISGSAELRQAYDELQQKEKELKESTMFQYQKKRGIAAEKKQFKEQKKEAEKYNELTERIAQFTLKHNLMQLFYIQKDLKELKGRKTDKMKQLQDLGDKQTALLDTLQSEKQEQAKHQHEALKLQKKIRASEKALGQSRPDIIKAQEEVSYFERRIRDEESEVKRFEKLYAEQQKKIQQLKEDLKEIDRQEAEFEQQLADQATKDITLSPDQMKTYSKLKEEVGKRTATEAQELQQLDRQYKLESSTLESLKTQKDGLEERKMLLEKEESQLSLKVEKITKDIDEAVENKSSLQSEYNTLLRKNEEAKRQQKDYSDKLRDIHQSLQEAKADLETKKFGQALDALKRLFPGVHGTITELAQPKNPRYNLAMTVVLGGHMDSIVVQDEKTGMDCIQYMKEQRVGTATFLPLDTLKSKPIDEQLRNLGKRVYPIIDVIQFDASYQRAFEYICGSTLVVDNLELARKYAFGGKERHKVVALDGSLISKSGLMTGGLGASGRLEKKASRWDMKEVTKLKKNRDDYLKKLTEVGHQLRSFAREQQLASEISQLETRHKSAKYELELATSRVDKNRSEVAQLDKQIKKLAADIKAAEKSLQTLSAKLDKLRATVSAVEDEVFEDFNDEVGIESIREYESSRVDRAKQESETKIRYATQRSRIKHLLEYEETRDLGGTLQATKNRVEEVKKELRGIKKKADTATTTSDAERKKHEDLVASYEQEKELASKKEAEMKSVKTQINSIHKASAAVLKQVTSIENQQDQLRSRRHAIFTHCRREEIDIPLIEGELPADVDPESVEQMSQMLVEEDKIKINFEQLSKKLQDLNKTQQDEAATAFVERINTLAVERESIAPNLKAIERLGDVEKRLGSTNTEFEDAKAQARKAVEDFKAIRERRCRKFMKAFDHISKNIDIVYKELTGGSGAAYLTLENLEEPYLHGVTYNPMPPNKPFGAIENLSGGEKSVAALALLFAINSYKPSPFYVLDEVDAALDPTNVNRVANYMKNKAEKENVQFITISLKDKCFEKAGALVGVYIESEQDSSRTLTLDLTKYPSS